MESFTPGKARLVRTGERHSRQRTRIFFYRLHRALPQCLRHIVCNSKAKLRVGLKNNYGNVARIIYLTPKSIPCRRCELIPVLAKPTTSPLILMAEIN